MEDVKLPRVGESTGKSPLPRGVNMVRLDNVIVFVRWHRASQSFFPLPQEEQEALARKLGLI
jgi:hypothetical protein